MNFEEATRWLYGFQKFGIKLGLDRIGHIAKELGNPQDSYKSIHVGGTNGKGSVCKFLEGILVESGYTVGVYTSPHLQRINERITINKKEIFDDELISLVEKVKPIVEEMIKNGENPTFFEVFTAIAFYYFSEKKVDIVIIEVGLGGRFDATNILNPLVSVITNVSLEHQNVLGKTIEKIAFEKAGIIKDSVPVVTAADGKALEVIKTQAEEKNSSVVLIKDRFKRIEKQNFLVNGSLKDYKVQTKLVGSFQGENIALAIGAVETLQINGMFISEGSIKKGITKTKNIGRMEIVGTNPFIILDGAHNPAGMKHLSETLKNDFDYERLILVLGILSDKNVEEMLEIIVPLADEIIVTKSQNKRAAKPSDLKDMIEEIDSGKHVFVKEEIKDAIEHAKSVAGKKDLICICGSLFTVGEARNFF